MLSTKSSGAFILGMPAKCWLTFRSLACLAAAHCHICAVPVRANAKTGRVLVAKVKHSQPAISVV